MGLLQAQLMLFDTAESRRRVKVSKGDMIEGSYMCAV